MSNTAILLRSEELLMNRIKEVLQEKGIKQTWLAKEVGKSYSVVNAYVQNRRQPSLAILFKIAVLLGVEAKDLLIKNELTQRDEKEA